MALEGLRPTRERAGERNPWRPEEAMASRGREDMATVNDAAATLSATQSPVAEVRRAALDIRRALQLVLATIWLVDGLLQLQPFMFSRAFGTQMLAATAQGNPSAIAHSITWADLVIGHHSVVADAIFAVVQVLIGFGIAWRPTIKPALAFSIVWSCGVWWFGEGLGGLFSGTANPVNGAPGAVLLYAVLAVLLWPTHRPGAAPRFVAARAVRCSASPQVSGWCCGGSSGWLPFSGRTGHRRVCIS